MTKLFRNSTFLVLLTLVLFACKSSKSVSESGVLENNMTAKKLIKAHKKNTPDFKTLQAKLKVDYTQGDQTNGYSLTMRVEKDKAIWINATLSLVRAKITPDRVGFYNKLDNTFFDGDYALINDLLGTKLNFENLQNVLLGSTLFNVDNATHQISMHEASYVLAPNEQSTVFELFMLLNPKHFRADSQQVSQMLENRMLQIDYLAYQDVEEQMFPKDIKIFAIDGDRETTIALELKSISLNKELRFPFKIPSGFDEIKL